MRLTQFITVGAGVMIVLSTLFAVANFMIGQSADDASRAVMSSNIETLDSSRKLALKATDVRLDVVQVQQWLTDISATRGRDGLDDGLDRAAGYAVRLSEDIDTGRRLARELGRDDIAKSFDAVEAAFGPFYETGRIMAAAYVADGPAGGNVMMAGFDAAAEEISATIDAVLAEIDVLVAEQLQTAHAREQEALALESLRSNVTTGGNIVIILAIIGMAVFTRHQFNLLNTVAATATEIANGNYDAPSLGKSRWQEMSHLFKSIGVFRDNGKAMQDLNQDKQADQRREADERKLRDALQAEVSRVVAAAAEGEFSARIETRYDREDLDRLAGNMNALMSGVEHSVIEIGKTLEAIAHDDLTRRVTSEFRGAFSHLKNDTNAVADRLTEIVGRLRETSSVLKSATADILAGAKDLGTRTGKQAVIVSETSGAMTHIAATVAGSAEKAGEVHDKSAAMSASAREGGKVMEQATDAMERISASSARISSIIGMIDDIAFQTNLLSLNASVEAARAGDAGKGFAVVAVEVRRLAQSAAEASAEVKALIEQSGEEVAGGTRLVGDAAERLLSMLAVMAENTAEMEAISRQSHEQARAIGEIDTSVNELEKMTQNNAALAEQTNSAIARMDDRVNEIDALVNLFKLAGTSGAAALSSDRVA